jgi:hypothetical protein
MHGVTAVVASLFRGCIPTLIAQPSTRRCLDCSRKTCPFVAVLQLQWRSHARGWALSKNSLIYTEGEKRGNLTNKIRFSVIFTVWVHDYDHGYVRWQGVVEHFHPFCLQDVMPCALQMLSGAS